MSKSKILSNETKEKIRQGNIKAWEHRKEKYGSAGFSIESKNRKLKNGLLEFREKSYSNNKIEYLPNRMINIKCHDCGRIDTMRFRRLNEQIDYWFNKGSDYLRRCHWCAGNYFTGGEKASNWKGGIVKNFQGYVDINTKFIKPEDVIFLNDSEKKQPYIREHRLVMARNLNRPLLESEHVHHINGKKDDNRIENLQLFTPSEHIAVTKMETNWENQIKYLQEENLKLKEQLFELVDN